MPIEQIRNREEDEQLLTQVKYDIFYKRRDLEFAMAKNFSRHRNLETRLHAGSKGMKFRLFIIVSLLLAGAVFAFLISIGNSLVTMAMGLIYILDAIIYFGVLFRFFFKFMEQFMRWLENSDTDFGNEYCEKNGIFTMHMEQIECASQIAKYQIYIKVLDEMEEKLKALMTKEQLLELSAQIQKMEIEPEVPNGKTQNTREENVKYGLILAGFILIFVLALFL